MQLITTYIQSICATWDVPLGKKNTSDKLEWKTFVSNIKLSVNAIALIKLIITNIYVKRETNSIKFELKPNKNSEEMFVHFLLF